MRCQSKYLISYQSPLDTISERDAGGKGWNLFRLKRFGFPVPCWCVVSSRIFDEVVRSQRERIKSILSNIDFANRAEVDDASSWIGKLILQSELPRGFSGELEATLTMTFGEKALLSVRSSVIGEDSKDNSFAGQMDSFLNVRAREVEDAIKKVWASAFSSRALVYRREKGISLTDVSAAVIIQQMVQSVSSGILFTRDPESRGEVCVISAGLGLGEGVVANMVETDTYRIDWRSPHIQKDVGSKSCRIVLDAGVGRGNRVQSVPVKKRTQQVLTDAQIRRLRDLGIKAEKCFRAPQDIEWGSDGRGKLFVLQARPIVFGPRRVSSPKVRIWDNSNIVESYPGLTLPLTFSFVRANYESIFRNATLGFLLFRKRLRRELSFFENMIGLLDGRIYYNLLCWYQMLSYLPGFKKHKDSWDQMIGISHKIRFPESKLSWPNRLYSLLMVMWKLIGVGPNARKFFAHFNRVHQRFKDLDFGSATEDEVIAAYHSLRGELVDIWHLTLYNDFCAMKYYDWLKKLCGRWGLDSFSNLHNSLLCGEKGVESVKPVRSLVRLAELLRTDPGYESLTNEDENHAIWKKIQTDQRYAVLRDAINLHLSAFGDRGLEELKLERPTFREDPAALIGLIRSYYLRGLSVESMESGERKIRGDAEDVMRRNLKDPFRRLALRFVLKNARLAIANRENMRFARTRLYGIVRRLFGRLGELFQERGLLKSASDIHYLTVEEAFGLVQGTAVTQSLEALVELRKIEYSQFARRHLKERMETLGVPYLSSLCEDEPDQRTTRTLSGIGCSSGTAEGIARVVLTPDSEIGGKQSILVAKSTDPGWVFLMLSSKGIVVERGSVLSHTAIIGRELGIPTIVGVKDATRLIRDGARISINGSKGEIRWQ